MALMKYEMRDLGELSWFLGIRVIRDRSQKKLWLCQDSYIKKIAATFHLTVGPKRFLARRGRRGRLIDRNR